MRHVSPAVLISALVAAAGSALAQQSVPMEKAFSTADDLGNGPGYVPTSGSLSGTQTWLKRFNSALQSTPATIDGSGNVAFTAVLTAGVGGVVGGPFDAGVGKNQFTFWYGGPGSVALQARYGDATLDNANCGGAGATFINRATASVAISPAGYMAIGAYQITGGNTTSADQNVIWAGQAGAWYNLVRGNDVLPNVGNSHETGNVTSGQSALRMNDFGQAAYYAQTRANMGDTGAQYTNDSFIGVATTGMDTYDSGTGLCTNTGVRKVVRAMDDLLGGGTRISGFYEPAFNHDASVFNIYAMAIGQGGVTGTSDSLVVLSTYAAGAYTHQIIGREGGPTGVGSIEYGVAPNTGSGSLVDPITPHSPFTTIAGQGLSNAGRAVWATNLKQGVGGIDASNDGAIMTHKDGVTSIVAQKGPASAIDPVLPGNLAINVNITGFSSAFRGVTLSNGDQVAWIGTLSAGGTSVLNDEFLAVSTIAPDGSVAHRLIMREGDQVPGMAPGTLWGGDGGTNGWSNPYSININAGGIVIFGCRLTGTGITTSTPSARGNDWALWAYYPSCGTIRLIARTWDTVGGLTLDGQYASLAWNTNPNGEGSANALNDANWFSFTAFDGRSAAAQGDAAVMRVHFCPADIDDGSGTGQPDGGIDINDLLFFLAQYESGTCGADLDGGAGNGLPDGGVDINDLLFFLARYEGGC